MRSLELVGRVYNPSAKYLKHRRVLVDWLCEVGEDTRLAMSTVHCAVAYMDAFLQRMEVHRSRLQLVAMAALDIAAKYEEAEERVPSADVLNASANHSYPPHMLHQMSVLILNRCSRGGKWGLLTQIHVTRCLQARLDAHGCDAPPLSRCLPRRGAVRELLTMARRWPETRARRQWMPPCTTTLPFLQGSLCVGDTIGRRPASARIARYVAKYTDFFADLALQDYGFYEYRPSALAAAIVCAARRALVIRFVTLVKPLASRNPAPTKCPSSRRPLWNAELSARLNCDWSDVSGIFDRLWVYYAGAFPAEVAEHARQEFELEGSAEGSHPTDVATPDAATAATPPAQGPVARTVVDAMVTPPDEAEGGAERYKSCEAEGSGRSPETRSRAARSVA